MALKEAKTLKVYVRAIVLVASVDEIVSKLQKYQTPFLLNCSLVTCQQIRCEVVVTRIVLFERAVFISVQPMRINLGFLETAHLTLPQAIILLLVRSKC